LLLLLFYSADVFIFLNESVRALSLAGVNTARVCAA
jgi:hypothetical protein